MPQRDLKVALVHDYLIKIGGAEKVLEALHRMFPDAPVFTLLYNAEATQHRYASYDIRTSWLQRAPKAHTMVDYYRALMPQAVESFDLTEYDLVISDVSGFVKGAITQPETIHISYIHTPTRFLWLDSSRHIAAAKFSRVTKYIIPTALHYLRQWDFIAASRPDRLVANSETTKSRISKFYRRDAVVVHPPVDVEKFDHTKRLPEHYFITIARLEPHKDLEILINACNQGAIPLKIIGTGTHERVLQQTAGPTIEFLGRVSDQERDHYLYGAKAFVALQTEDFGIAMVEALAAGCPVIAKAKGGATEIVQSGKTGILLSEITMARVVSALEEFDPQQYSAAECAASVSKFNQIAFERSMQQLISQALDVHKE